MTGICPNCGHESSPMGFISGDPVFKCHEDPCPVRTHYKSASDIGGTSDGHPKS